MSVSTFATGGHAVSGSGTSFNYSNLTVASGQANNAIILCASFSAAVTGVTAVWDSGTTNQSMYQIGSVNQSGSNPIQFLFGLRGPTPRTSGNLLISWTGAAVCDAVANHLVGVSQASDTIAFTNWLTVGGTASSATVSSTAAYTTSGQQSLIYASSIGSSPITGVNNATWFTANSFSGSLCAGGTYGAPTGTPWASTIVFTGSTLYGAQAVEIAPALSGAMGDRPLLIGRGPIPRAGAPLSMLGTKMFPFPLPVQPAAPVVQGATLPMMGVG